MNKTLALLTALMTLGGFAAPAFADTSVSFVFDDGPGPRHHVSDRRDDWHRHRPRPWHRTPVFYAPAPLYVPPPRPVVYETTVVTTPAPRYVVETSLPAQQVSTTFTDTYGRTCREYQSDAWVAGSRKPVYGTACLQADGAWRIVD